MPSLPWRLLHLLALSTMAITQPLLSILGNNPTFFTAHSSSAGQIVGFALMVALVPTAVLATLETTVHLMNRRVGLWMHLGLLSVLGFLFVIQIVDVVPGPWPLVVILAAALTGGLVEAYRRSERVRTAVSILGATPLLFVATFLFVSPASSVVFPDDVDAVELADLLDRSDLLAPTGDGANDDATPSGSPATFEQRVNERFPPIYILVLDEVPMASLLDENGNVDAARWPNFARIAATSNLFSNATTVGFTTETAIPTMLTGSYEIQAAPVYSLYPENLFTLLGDIYDTSSSDPIVDLCPPSVCNGAPPQALLDLLASGDEAAAPTTAVATTLPAPTTTARPTPPAEAREARIDSSFGLLVKDASIVFGQLAVPDGLDIGLPSIGAGWGNFGGDLSGNGGSDGGGDLGDLTTPTAPTPTTAPSTTTTTTTTTTPTTTTPLTVDVGIDPTADVVVVDPDAINQRNTDYLDSLLTDDSRVGDFRAEVARISASSVPRLNFLHIPLPHVPWRLHGNGDTYADIGLSGYFSMWDDDLVTARAGQQRHLLQLQFADRLLGEYLDKLEAEGIFEKATVVVTADHGISFVPGARARGIGDINLGGIAGVPLFYKLPGQSAPARFDKPVETIDIVATIANQLAIDLPWDLDGADLFGPEIVRDRAVLHPFSAQIPDPFPPAVAAVTEALIAAFGNGTEGNLYALAGLPELIGEKIDGLVDDPVGYCWVRDRPTSIPEADGATGFVFGAMSTSRNDTIDFAIVVDGVLTGTSRTLDDDVRHRVYGLADPQYWAGASLDDIALLEIDDGRLRPIAIC